MPAGRPTVYSLEVLQKTREYVQRFWENKDIPYIEELAHELGVHSETLRQWQKDEDKQEFSLTVKSLEDLQKMRLQKGATLNKYNATAAIFQLKANHGMIETEKRILAGDQNQPLVVKIEDYTQ